MNHPSVPQWHHALHQQLTAMADTLQQQVTGWHGPETVITPSQMGYTCGLATEAIQAAIDQASALGGGTVLLAEGDYVTGTLVMKSNVRLMVAKGCRLLASTDLQDFPEHICRR